MRWHVTQHSAHQAAICHGSYKAVGLLCGIWDRVHWDERVNHVGPCLENEAILMMSEWHRVTGLTRTTPIKEGRWNIMNGNKNEADNWDGHRWPPTSLSLCGGIYMVCFIRMFACLISRLIFTAQSVPPSHTTLALMRRLIRWPLVIHYLKQWLFNSFLAPVHYSSDTERSEDRDIMCPQASVGISQRRIDALRVAVNEKSKINK